MIDELWANLRDAVRPSDLDHDWYDDSDAVADARVDTVLRAIFDAGYVLVDRDRMDRLIEAGREYRAMLASQCGAYVGVTRDCTPVVTEDDVRYEWEAGG